MLRLSKNFLLFQLLGITSILLLASCQSMLQQTEKEQRRAEILQTQKSLIISFLNKGLPGMALKDLRDYIKANPEDPDFYNLLGLTQLALKDTASAIKSFKKANNIEPRIPFALNIASAYIDSSENKKAIQLLKDLKKQDGYEDYAHPERIDHNIGLALERINNLKEAEHYYQLAIHKNPEFYISLVRLGSIYYEQKQYNKSRTMFRKARKNCTNCFDPANGLAMTYIALGKPGKAIASLKAFLKEREVSEQDMSKAREMLKMTAKFQKSEVKKL